MGEEMSQHLGYDKHDSAVRGSGNSRNGSSGKRLLTDIGGIDLDVPRDNGSFAPQIVRKGQTRLDGFNDRIIALYARGLSTRDVHAHLREMYDIDVSRPDRGHLETSCRIGVRQTWSRCSARRSHIAAVHRCHWCGSLMACGLLGHRAGRGWKGFVLLEVAVPSLL